MKNAKLIRVVGVLLFLTALAILIYSNDLLSLTSTEQTETSNGNDANVKGRDDDDDDIPPKVFPTLSLEPVEEVVETKPPAEASSPTDTTTPTTPTTPAISTLTYEEIINEPLDKKLERMSFKGAGYNQVIITTCSYAFRNFLYNWLCSVRNLPDSADLLGQILIYTVDEELAKDIIVNKKLTTNVYLEKLQQGNSGPLDYATGPYRVLIKHRTNFIKRVLVDFNYRVLLADNDAVWLQRPLPHLTNTYINYDMLAQNDGNEHSPITCGGFLYLNNTEKMKNVWTRVAGDYERLVNSGGNANDNEQFMLQRMSHAYSIKLLPHENYPSGIVYFSKRNPPEDMPNVHVVHNNFVIGAQKKLERFTRFPGLLWQIDDNLDCKPRTK